MSDTSPTHDVEVEEGSPMGGATCEDSSPEPPMMPAVEYGEAEQIEENLEDHHYPFDNLAVELYEGTEEDGASNSQHEISQEKTNSGDVERAAHAENVHSMETFHEDNVAVHEQSTENMLTEDNCKSNAEDSIVENVNLMVSGSTSNLFEPSIDMKEDDPELYYKELQKAYIQDLYRSSSTSFVEACDTDEIRGVQLSRFPKIAKAVETSDYETLQLLYQLLYQRSAWDKQEILVQRILGFSGFNFGKDSEDYYNREMMLRTLPDHILMKIASIIGLDQFRNTMLGLSKAKMDLISLMLEFLTKPQKKTRGSKIHEEENSKNSAVQLPTEKCGCRNHCLRKFTENDRKNLLNFLEELRVKKMLDSFIISLMTCKKIERKHSDECKKLKEVLYTYKVKMGNKEVNVCKGGFVILNGLKMGKVNQLQIKLKTGGNLPAKLKPERLPPIPNSEIPDLDTSSEKSTLKLIKKPQTPPKEKAFVKLEEPAIDKTELLKMEEELKERINLKDSTDSLDGSTEESESSKEKLKDFPLVVKSIENAPQELLIDIHFLLFLNSAEVEKVKDNILEFSGFTFDVDTEENDERKEFLLRMSNKIVADVAKSFSLAIFGKKEDTIKNILSFLRKPDESFLKTTGSAPVILSDVEFDDMDNLSDSDVSITCEVVEKKVECIDLISSGEESDKDDKPAKEKQKSSSVKKQSASQAQAEHSTNSVATPETAAANFSATQSSSSSGSQRALKHFETICKIVNTHPHEYLIDIYDLLYMKKHEPSTLRKDILEFSGFTFDKGSPEYIKRKHLLDRMLYNSVRRIYNTLIHNTTEVKIFSKPTMIAEIFQFLFKLPDHDTSLRPVHNKPQNKTPSVKSPIVHNVTNVLAGSTQPPVPPLSMQQGKLSDLKRVFQRVACFPCEYLTDVHKLLFMTDCDSKVIRQNIFGFKGFSFSVDSPEFQQRKMYLEYLTFHSLRKISSVLTTRSVDLRNSTKHELATHLTQVLAEYTNTYVESEPIGAPDSSNADNENSSASATTDQEVENIVVTPILEPLNNASPPATPESSDAPVSAISSSSDSPVDKPVAVDKNVTLADNSLLSISIVDARSVGSPAVSTTSPRNRRKRKQKFDASPKKKIAPQPPEQQPFADINLPEIEQYRQLYGQNLNIYAQNLPTMTGITTFSSPGVVQQPFPQIVPQTLSFPMVHPYSQPMQVQSPFSAVQQPSQVLGVQPQLGASIIPTVAIKPSEIIVPGENVCVEPSANEASLQKAKLTSTEKISLSSGEKHCKIRDAVDKEDEEDCDKPLSSLIGHPNDSVLKKQICDIVEQTDLQDITINGVIHKIYNMYPKFDLSYRKEFIKSTLRSILYRLGDQKPSELSNTRETNSPDCSVSTTNIPDNVVLEPETVLDTKA